MEGGVAQGRFAESRFAAWSHVFFDWPLPLTHPLLDRLDASLRDVIRSESVQFRGEWTTSARRTCQSGAQVGTGSAAFIDVVDSRWSGALASAVPISGIAFLVTGRDLYWVKAAQVSLILPVDVSLYAHAGYAAGRATFTANMAGAYLPGIPVAGGADLAGSCTLGPDRLTTGRVTCLASVNTAALFVLLFPRDLLKVGRKHLWRLRDEVAASLPEELRVLLTRRRTGSVNTNSL